MKGRILLVGMVAASLFIGSGIGNATGTSGLKTDGRADVIEPILTRSENAEVRTNTASLASNKLGNANITSFSLSADSATDKITAVVNVKTPLIVDAAGALTIAPYGGQHLLVLFQTDEFEDETEVMGQGATGNDVTWGDNGLNADKFRWHLYYGWTLSENKTVCGLGFYDPTGALLPPAPVFFGQTFFILAQEHEDPNTTCVLSNGNKTVTITQPYTFSWLNDKGRPTAAIRSKRVVNDGQTIRNISAFSWMDHEIGGPEPVGLILGYTWYTDAVPATSYKYGTIAGDPNPNSFSGPQCILNDPDVRDVTGEPRKACTTPNPVGAGFVNSGITVTA